MKRILSIVLMVMLLCSTTVFAETGTSEIMPRDSAFFSSYGATLSRQGSGKIKIIFSTTGIGICDELGVVNYEVERLNSDNEWVRITDSLNGSTGEDVATYTFSKYFYGTTGETYRIHATFISIIDGDYETKAYTSGGLKA